MNFAALFAIQGNSGSFLGTSIAHVILSPFTDDQHTTHTILGFPLSKKPVVR